MSTNENSGMIMQIIKLKSSLTIEEITRIANERKPQFEAIQGLVQKYYLAGDNPDDVAGVYIWKSREDLDKYRVSELAKSIPEAYGLTEPPTIEIKDIIIQLRD